MHFAKEKAAVLTLLDPVVFFRKDDQTTRNAEALQHAPVFQGLIKRHAKVILADSKQDWRAKVLRQADRVLLPPNLALLPDGAPIVDFAMLEDVTRSPLRFQINQTGVADETFVARRGGLEPIRQMTAVASAARSHVRRVDERETTCCFVG